MENVVKSNKGKVATYLALEDAYRNEVVDFAT